MLTPFSLKLLGQIKNILSLVDWTSLEFVILAWIQNSELSLEPTMQFDWLNLKSSIVFKNYILWFNGA
jgi:hypothetical protein